MPDIPLPLAGLQTDAADVAGLPNRRRRPWPIASAVAVALTAGCSSAVRSVQRVPTTKWVEQARAVELSVPFADDELQAMVVPPVGWRADPRKRSARHTHQVWISPSGNTAYGVIRFALPLPVGLDLTLWGFLREMRNRTGEATLLTRADDAALPGLRFEAEGGPYKLRCNLIVDGRRGWAVYAATRRTEPVDEPELTRAANAREQTRVNVGER